MRVQSKDYTILFLVNVEKRSIFFCRQSLKNQFNFAETCICFFFFHDLSHDWRWNTKTQYVRHSCRLLND